MELPKDEVGMISWNLRLLGLAAHVTNCAVNRSPWVGSLFVPLWRPLSWLLLYLIVPFTWGLLTPLQITRSPARIPTSSWRGPQEKCNLLQETKLAPDFRTFLLDHQTQRGPHGLETCIGFAGSATQQKEPTQLLQIWAKGEQKGMERRDDRCVCICSPSWTYLKMTKGVRKPRYPAIRKCVLVLNHCSPVVSLLSTKEDPALVSLGSSWKS